MYSLIQVKKKLIVQGIFYEPSILHALLKKKPKLRKLIWDVVPKREREVPLSVNFLVHTMLNKNTYYFVFLKPLHVRVLRKDDNHCTICVCVSFTACCTFFNVCKKHIKKQHKTNGDDHHMNPKKQQ